MFKSLILHSDRNSPLELSAIAQSAFVCQDVDIKILLNKVLSRYSSVVQPLLVCLRMRVL